MELMHFDLPVHRKKGVEVFCVRGTERGARQLRTCSALASEDDAASIVLGGIEILQGRIRQQAPPPMVQTPVVRLVPGSFRCAG